MNSIQITALDESKSSKKFSRDHIIKILGEEFPLSIANIHQKIKEKNDFDATIISKTNIYGQNYDYTYRWENGVCVSGNGCDLAK